MNKPLMTQTEARILIYLKMANPKIQYAKFMSASLEIDYNRLLNVLYQMEFKNWIKRQKNLSLKIFYNLTGKANLQTAMEILDKKMLKQIDRQTTQQILKKTTR